MKIVYLNPTGVLGGGERSLLDLIAAIRAHDRSIEMHVIACDEGPLVEGTRRAGASAQVLSMPPSLARAGDAGLRSGRRLRAVGELFRAGVEARSFARRLDDAIAAAGADVVHSNGIKTHLLSGMSRLGVPIVWHLRDFIGARAIVGRVLSRAARRGVRAIAVSRAVADDARGWLGRRSTSVPIDVVYNAVDTDHFAPAKGEGAWLDALAGSCAPSPDVVRVGLVATYARWKGHDLLLHAARIVRDRAADVSIRFYIVGGAIYRTGGSQFGDDELRALARRYGVEDRVVGFVPFQSDPAPVYRALDVVVHASTRPEPFGRSIVEAMACARPVIVSNAGGAAEIIRDGHDAIAFRPNDAGALAEAVLRLARDAELRRKLGDAARRTACERFARDRLGAQVIDIYRRWLASTSTGSI